MTSRLAPSGGRLSHVAVGPLVDAFDAEGGGRPPSWAEVPLQPTGAKGTSDVKLETFEDFREGENLKSRQLLVSRILRLLCQGRE